ncbi:MAG: hypothetical protein JWN99_2560 [Ilumatobacteraceae bacterium]|nr:hypothetical protein [Ilumatobacteraceae bacterium]
MSTRPNPDRASHGDGIALTSIALAGRPFLDNNRYIYDLTQEIDPGTGRRWFNTVVVIGPRQTTKSTGVEAFLTWSNNRRPSSTSLYMAQTRDYARIRVLDEWEEQRLSKSPATRGRYRPVKSNGREGIKWVNGSQTRIAANNASAGHGLTIDGEAVVDEAFAHEDLTSIAALSPTQVTCPEPQLWIMSTLGDGTDGLLMHFEDVGLAALSDPDSRTCYVNWSAEPGAPVDSEATWRTTIATIDVSITVAALRQQLVNLGEAEFDRAFLCRRRTETHAQFIPAAAWTRQLRPAATEPVAPFVVTYDVAHDRTSASLAVAARTGNGHELVVIVDKRPGTSWLVDALLDVQRSRRPAAIYADPRSPGGSMIDKLEARGVHITSIDTIEFTKSLGVLYDGLVDDADVVHIGQPDLDIAVAQARTRPLGDARAWNRTQSPVDIAPLCAATLAVWAHRHIFPHHHRSSIR